LAYFERNDASFIRSMKKAFDEKEVCNLIS
jgi:hypothetical protein